MKTYGWRFEDADAEGKRRDGDAKMSLGVDGRCVA